MPKTGRPVAVFDIDGTIFRSSLLIEGIRGLIDGGLFPASIESEYAASYSRWLNREASYEDYIDNVVNSYVRHISGVRVDAAEAVARDVIASGAGRVYRFTRDLISSLKPSHFLLAISGSPSELVAEFCRHYGFDTYHATEFGQSSGRFTDRARVGSDQKDQTLKQVVADHTLTLSGSVGVGDTESDAAFLRLVERPIAFNPNAQLFEMAVQADWKVVVERKDVIYHYGTDAIRTPN